MSLTPRTFHRIWLSEGPDDVIPLRFEAFWERLKQLHPGWEFITWNRADELTFMRNRDLFDAQTNHAGRSDIARYEILAEFGGVYLDTDVEPLRSFEPLVSDPLGVLPFAGWEDANLICPTVMGSPARHPAIVDLVKRLSAWAAPRMKKPPNQQTGPYFLTKRWKYRDDVTLYAPVRFYPVHWSARRFLGGPYPDASFCVHHWNQGWDTEAKARIDARQRAVGTVRS